MGDELSYANLGDTEKNYLNFYKLIDGNKFEDNFLDSSKSYKDMQWVHQIL